MLKISDSITYDPLKKYLRARCGSLEANFATFKTVLELLDNKLVDYATNINNSIDDRLSIKQYVEKKIREKNN